MKCNVHPEFTIVCFSLSCQITLQLTLSLDTFHVCALEKRNQFWNEKKGVQLSKAIQIFVHLWRYFWKWDAGFEIKSSLVKFSLRGLFETEEKPDPFSGALGEKDWIQPTALLFGLTYFKERAADKFYSSNCRCSWPRNKLVCFVFCTFVQLLWPDQCPTH